MSSKKRWMLAVLMAVILIGGTLILSMGGLVIMIMGMDSCASGSSLPDWVNYYPFIPPGVMILGSLAGSIMFGLDKRWYWSAGIIVSASIVSLIIAVAWFPIVGSFC